jgi:hypothetical protein
MTRAVAHHTPRPPAHCLLVTCSLLSLLASVRAANAQWTVTRLHPEGASNSAASGIFASGQAGETTIAGVRRAVVWNSTAQTWRDLSPAGAFDSRAAGAKGDQQVGYVQRTGETQHAAMWNGSAASWIDLHPAAASQSYAFATDGTQQVGFANVEGAVHACVWSGGAESWVDLNPPGIPRSIVQGVAGGFQIGSVYVGNRNRASLWNGSAASRIELHPAGSDDSAAVAGFGTQQVGYAQFDGLNYHAGLWHGTAESWVDLHPPGVGERSFSIATCGAWQAGYVQINGVPHSSVWNGTAGSWEDLSRFLSPSFRSSSATDVASDGVLIWVVGSGLNTVPRQTEALLWSRPVCAGDFNRSGATTAQDIFDFLAAWFSADPAADFNGNGLSVQDIFDFLNAWFARC